MAVGAGPAAARRDFDFHEALFAEQLRDAHQVVETAGKHDRLRGQLVDRVVGRQDRAVGGADREISREAARPQLGAEERVRRQKRRVRAAGAESSGHAGTAGGKNSRRTRRLKTIISVAPIRREHPTATSGAVRTHREIAHEADHVGADEAAEVADRDDHRDPARPRGRSGNRRERPRKSPRRS